MVSALHTGNKSRRLRGLTHSKPSSTSPWTTLGMDKSLPVMDKFVLSGIVFAAHSLTELEGHG